MGLQLLDGRNIQPVHGMRDCRSSQTHWLMRRISSTKDLQQQNEKMKGMGSKALEAMKKALKVAEIRSAKHEALNEIQQQAIRFLKENGCIEESDLGSEYQSEKLRISLNEVGVCSKCRHQSGCYMCDQWKCLRYFMRQAHKKSGKPIRPEFQ